MNSDFSRKYKFRVCFFLFLIFSISPPTIVSWVLSLSDGNIPYWLESLHVLPYTRPHKELWVALVFKERDYWPRTEDDISNTIPVFTASYQLAFCVFGHRDGSLTPPESSTLFVFSEGNVFQHTHSTALTLYTKKIMIILLVCLFTCLFTCQHKHTGWTQVQLFSLNLFSFSVYLFISLIFLTSFFDVFVFWLINLVRRLVLFRRTLPSSLGTLPWWLMMYGIVTWHQ